MLDSCSWLLAPVFLTLGSWFHGSWLRFPSPFSMKKHIDIGVVGCGYWGPNLIRNFRSVPSCRMKVMCDLNQERLAHLHSLYPDVECESDVKRLIADPDLDAVVVALPVRLHFPIAKAFLEAVKRSEERRGGKECV